ncbi:hypothetical protein, partial [Pedobacter sp. HMWF019]|uniref:hypothetical protein n=1 Tax=Pedobacter sp. HMWF019 TaxID=2056856 RepID=UPI0018EE5A4C
MKKNLIFGVIVLLFLFSCKSGGDKSSSVDSTMTSLDTVLKGSHPAFLDTLSSTSLKSLRLEDTAFEMMTKLKKEFDTVTVDKIKYYVVEGDLLMDKDELYFYCLKRLMNKDKQPPQEEIQKSGKLTVAVNSSGSFAIWPKNYVIRYSVLKNSFHSPRDYQLVVDSVKIAARDWMS